MKKVLFIEDDEKTNKVYAARFSNTYQVLFVVTGTEGITAAIKEKPDLIILDIMLGGKLNGFDVLKELKLHPETTKIPVFMLTNLEDQEKAAIEAGAVKCLIKANTPLEEIAKNIAQILS